MSIVKEVNRRDFEGLRGKRAILFSVSRTVFMSIIFNVLQSVSDMLQNFFVFTHPVLRTDATLTLTALKIKPVYIPKGATHFRVQNHLSSIADYQYSEGNRRYEPLGQLNGQSALSIRNTPRC